MRFDLEIGRVEGWIRQRGYSSVAIQLPEGLKSRATEISDRLSEDLGVRVAVLGRACYGACDVSDDYKRQAECLVHFGHSPIPNLPADEDVLFVEAAAETGIEDALVPVLDSLPDSVGLIASVQYVHLLDEAKRIIKEHGKKVSVGQGDGRICHSGQILGCNVSSAESVEKDVDCFLFVGEGGFHPLAAAMGSKKRVFTLNPATGTFGSMDDARDRMIRRRFANVESAKSSKRFLVIVCSRPGQFRPDDADRVENMLRNAGKKVYRVVTDEITPDALLPYDVDAYVCTACPRLALDDQARYKHPMLTVTEAEIVAGLRSWEDYAFDAIRRSRHVKLKYGHRMFRRMLTSDILFGENPRDVKVGIGCKEGSVAVPSSVRAFNNPNVSCYTDAEALAEDLASGAIEAAVRGDLPSSELLPILREKLGLKRLERALVMDIRGRAILMAPVGIDEGWSVSDRTEMAIRGADLMGRLGGSSPRIAVMAGGRDEDRGRCGKVDRSLDDANEIVKRLKSKGLDAYGAQILIERAVDDAEIIIAPDGICGNLIFRTLHFIGNICTLGAPVLNSDKVFVDTSREKNDYTDALAMATKLAGMR